MHAKNRAGIGVCLVQTVQSDRVLAQPTAQLHWHIVDCEHFVGRDKVRQTGLPGSRSTLRYPRASVSEQTPLPRHHSPGTSERPGT